MFISIHMLFSTPLNKPLRLTEALWGLKSCTDQQTQDTADAAEWDQPLQPGDADFQAQPPKKMGASKAAPP